MDKTKGFFSKRKEAFMNGVEEARNRKEIERKIEHLEEIISSHPNENLKTLLDEKGEFGLSTTGLWGLSEIGIQELMEEMGIEKGSYWEMQIHRKINEIRERKKKERITGNPFL